jgi:hypothetical protein
MTHPGLLMRAHKIPKSNTTWYTGRRFTVLQGQARTFRHAGFKNE